MREIKFRAKTFRDDEWVYWSVTGQKPVGVKKDTIGEYTGLVDKNGKEIYTSDYVKSVNDEIWEVREGEWMKEWRDEEWKMFGLHLWNMVERDYQHRETELNKDVILEIVGNVYEGDKI